MKRLNIKVNLDLARRPDAKAMEEFEALIARDAMPHDMKVHSLTSFENIVARAIKGKNTPAGVLTLRQDKHGCRIRP